MSAEEVLAAWFNFGEDALVEGAGEHAWNSGTVVKDFAAQRLAEPEERNWRALDPRRDGDLDATDDDDDDGADFGDTDDDEDDEA